MAGEPREGIIPGIGGMAEYQFPEVDMRPTPDSGLGQIFLADRKIRAREAEAEVELEEKKEKKKKAEKKDELKFEPDYSKVPLVTLPAVKKRAAEIYKHVQEIYIPNKNDPKIEHETQKMMADFYSYVGTLSNFNTTEIAKLSELYRKHGRDGELLGTEKGGAYDALTSIYMDENLTPEEVINRLVEARNQVYVEEEYDAVGEATKVADKIGLEEGEQISWEDEHGNIHYKKGWNETKHRAKSDDGAETNWDASRSTRNYYTKKNAGDEDAGLQEYKDTVWQFKKTQKSAEQIRADGDDEGSGDKKIEAAKIRKELIARAQAGDKAALDHFVGGDIDNNEIMDVVYDVSTEEDQPAKIKFKLADGTSISYGTDEETKLYNVMNTAQEPIKSEILARTPSPDPVEQQADIDHDKINEDVAKAQNPKTGKEFLESFPMVTSVEFDIPLARKIPLIGTGEARSVTIKYNVKTPEGELEQETKTIDLRGEAGGGYELLREFILKQNREAYITKGKSKATGGGSKYDQYAEEE
jgi:hypothetical protein